MELLVHGALSLAQLQAATVGADHEAHAAVLFVSLESAGDDGLAAAERTPDRTERALELLVMVLGVRAQVLDEALVAAGHRPHAALLCSVLWYQRMHDICLAAQTAYRQPLGAGRREVGAHVVLWQLLAAKSASYKPPTTFVSTMRLHIV